MKTFNLGKENTNIHKKTCAAETDRSKHIIGAMLFFALIRHKKDGREVWFLEMREILPRQIPRTISARVLINIDSCFTCARCAEICWLRRGRKGKLSKGRTTDTGRCALVTGQNVHSTYVV